MSGVSWWGAEQFGIVPRSAIRAIMATAADTDQARGTTAVAVFTALATSAAAETGTAQGGVAAAAELVGMNPRALRRVVTAVLVPAGVASMGPGGSVRLHMPGAGPAPTEAPPDPQPTRSTARETRSTARNDAQHCARTSLTEDLSEFSQSARNPCAHSDGAQLALVADEPLDDAGGFDAWYAAYPRKRSRADAHKAYRQALRRRGVTPRMLLDAALRLASDPNLPTGDDRQFIPYPGSWLRAEGYLDGPLEARGRVQAPPPSRTAVAMAGFRKLAGEAQERDRARGLVDPMTGLAIGTGR